MNNPNPVALITGAARRIGAVIAQTLHQQGYNIVLHYNNSQVAAEKLAAEFNQQRHNSCTVFAANLSDLKQIDTLATHAMSQWQRIDLLINNASSFYPTPLTAATEQQWDDLFASNSKGPYFLSQALASTLKKHRGSIINIADIHTGQPLRDHSIYCMAKAANRMMTKSLAKELAPDVRVNGIAPGAIMWPEKRATLSAQQKQNIVAKTPLNRTGAPEDIAQLAHFLAAKASYITGEVIAVDGGRKLS